MFKEKRKYIIIFLILIVITNIIFIPFISGHMTTDSYEILNKGYENYSIGKFFLDGRLFTGILTEIMSYFNVPVGIYVVISLEIALIISCIAVMVLANTFFKYKKTDKLSSKIILYIASYYTIFNVLYIENLYYIEACIIALSVLLYILAAKVLVERPKLYLIKSFILLLLGITSYQGTISLFFLATLVLAMCNEKRLKDIIVIMVKAVIMVLIGVLINSLQIKLVENIYDVKQTRVNTSYDGILINIAIILDGILNIISYMGGYCPPWSYVIIVLVIEALIFIKLIKQNKKNPDSNNQRIMIEQMFIVVCGIMFSCAISVISTTAFLSGRIRFALGAIVGFLFIHLWVKTDFAENKQNIFNKILIVLLILYGIANSVNYTWVMAESKYTQMQDKQEVLEMQKKVQKYENENNIKVTKIAVVVIENQTNNAFYPEIYHMTFVTHSAIKTQWSIVGCYNYYTGENLQEYEPSEEEINNYLSKEKEGYLCINDVLYVTAYMY